MGTEGQYSAGQVFVRVRYLHEGAGIDVTEFRCVIRAHKIGGRDTTKNPPTTSSGA